MKKILLIALFGAFLLGSAQAQDASIENVWNISKIKTATAEVDYADWDKTYSITITKTDLSINGSCIKGVVKDVKTDGGAITYTNKTTWDPGCCFFDNPNQELMKMPKFDGDYTLKGNSLTIYHGETTYYFIVGE